MAVAACCGPGVHTFCKEGHSFLLSRGALLSQTCFLLTLVTVLPMTWVLALGCRERPLRVRTPTPALAF